MIELLKFKDYSVLSSVSVTQILFEFATSPMGGEQTHEDAI